MSTKRSSHAGKQRPEDPPTRISARRLPPASGLAQALARGSALQRLDTVTPIAARSGPASALPAQTRSSMEASFGADFSGVRVHAKSERATALGAVAFAQGESLHFTAGAYQPGTTRGRQVLGHELAHVVQQRQGRVAPTRNVGGVSINEDAGLEAEADRQGRAAAAGQMANTGAPITGTASGAAAQRIVMTDAQWRTQSSKLAKVRSPALKEIDFALEDYNAASLELARENLNTELRARLAGLLKIDTAISNWKATKTDAKDEVVSQRRDAVDALVKAVDAERQMVLITGTQAADPVTAAGVMSAIDAQYTRGLHQVHAFLAMQPTPASRALAKGFWHDRRSDAMRIDHKARGLSSAGDAEFDAALATNGLRQGMRAFQTISYAHLGVEHRSSRKTRLANIKQLLKQDQQGLRDPTGPAGDFLKLVTADVTAYIGLAGAEPDADADERLPVGEDDAADFEILENVLGVLDKATEALGFQGTGGKGNEGFKDFYKAAPKEGTTDDRTDLQKDGQAAFDKLTPGSDAAKDQVSGVADIESAIGGLESNVIEALTAYRIYKDPGASPADKAKAKRQLIGVPLSTVSNAMKLVGGALTAHRSGGERDIGGSAALSGKDADGKDVADLSTDFKMAGDFFGLFAGIWGTIGNIIELVSFVRTGGGPSAKQQERTTRRDLEAAGNLILKYTSTVASLAGNYKSAAKLGYQIADGGQLSESAKAASGVTGVANAGGLVPGLQLLSAVMTLLQQSYKLHRLRLRSGALTARIDDHLKDAADADPIVLAALQVGVETLTKRMHRVGINLGHAVTQITAGGFSLSGIGTAPGMLIGLASGAARVGQVGARNAKQALRNRSAKKRPDGAESHRDWKQDKQRTAARSGSTLRRILAAVEIKLGPNWDKSSDKKAARNKEAALEILHLDDSEVFAALGVTAALDEEVSTAKRLAIVEGALLKRD